MANRFRIRINWRRLLTNMSRQDGRAMSRDEVRQRLVDAGFTHDQDDYWFVNEPDLGQLNPSEVISVDDA